MIGAALHLTYDLSAAALVAGGLSCLVLGLLRPATRRIALVCGATLLGLGTVIGSRFGVVLMLGLQRILRESPWLGAHAKPMQAGLVVLTVVVSIIMVSVVLRGRPPGKALLLLPACTALAMVDWLAGVSSYDPFEDLMKQQLLGIKLLGWAWMACGLVVVAASLWTILKTKNA